MPTIALSSEKIPNDEDKRIMHFGTDSYLIGVDNRTSYSMTPSITDYVTPLDPVDGVFVRGIGGFVKVQGKGSVLWKITDDDGISHDVIIPGTLYVKELDHRLLSPQHWSQTSNDSYPMKRGTRSITYEDELVLEWNQRKHIKTIPIDTSSNTFSFYTTPGLNRFQSYSSINEQSNHTWFSEQCILCNSAEVNTSDKSIDYFYDGFQETKFDKDNLPNRDKIRLYDEAYENLPAKDIKQEFMRWHYRLGHMSFRKMKLLSKLGTLPSRLQECDPPVCATCIYGGMTKRPWRTKPSKLPKSKLVTISKPG